MAAAQKHNDGNDWWWQLRFGMCYYQLGLFQEAIRQHEKSLALCQMEETMLHLNKCYLRIDQPLLAAKMFNTLAQQHPGANSVLLLLPCSRAASVMQQSEEDCRLRGASPRGSACS